MWDSKKYNYSSGSKIILLTIFCFFVIVGFSYADICKDALRKPLYFANKEKNGRITGFAHYQLQYLSDNAFIADAVRWRKAFQTFSEEPENRMPSDRNLLNELRAFAKSPTILPDPSYNNIVFLKAALSRLPAGEKRILMERLDLMDVKDYDNLARWVYDVGYIFSSYVVQNSYREEIDINNLLSNLSVDLGEKHSRLSEAIRYLLDKDIRDQVKRRLAFGKAVLFYGKEVRYNPFSNSFFIESRRIVNGYENKPITIHGPPKISIVVITYNGREDTERLFDTIANLDYPNFELILIDNNSSQDDRFYQLYKKGEYDKYPIAIFIRSDRNLLVAGGRNLGIQEALRYGTDYIFTIDNDMELDSDVLKYLVDQAEESNGMEIVVPKVYFLNDGVRSNRLNIAGSSLLRGTRGGEEIDIGKYDTKTEIDFPPGGAKLVPAIIFRRIGYEDSRCVPLEDLDWAVRLKGKANSRFVPKAVLWHKKSQIGISANSDLGMFNRTVGCLVAIRKYSLIDSLPFIVRFINNLRGAIFYTISKGSLKTLKGFIQGVRYYFVKGVPIPIKTGKLELFRYGRLFGTEGEERVGQQEDDNGALNIRVLSVETNLMEQILEAI